MTRDEWLALAARCEAATGADREIDGAIALAFGWTLQKMRGDAKPYWRKPGETKFYTRELSGPPAYTSSIDDITALIQRELPGWDWQVASKREDRDGCPAHVHGVFDRELLREGCAATPALALCAAFCRAMAEKAG
jgi:hypothetical protein